MRAYREFWLNGSWAVLYEDGDYQCVRCERPFVSGPHNLCQTCQEARPTYRNPFVRDDPK